MSAYSNRIDYDLPTWQNEVIYKQKDDPQVSYYSSSKINSIPGKTAKYFLNDCLLNFFFKK